MVAVTSDGKTPAHKKRISLSVQHVEQSYEDAQRELDEWDKLLHPGAPS